MKNRQWYVQEDFKSWDGDTRTAACCDDVDGIMVDWYFFETPGEAEMFVEEENKKLKIKGELG